MSDEKELKGTTIELHNKSIKLTPEDKTNPWWREKLNRQSDAILFPQIWQNMLRITQNLTKDDGTGKKVAQYNIFMTNLPPNPKSSQGKNKTIYKKHIVSYLKKKEEGLCKFKDKEVLVYVAIYLREKRYNTHDTDNFLKAIIDSLKDFIGDDSKVVSVLADKYKLENYPKEDLDFLEQVLIVVTDPEARSDILK